MEGYYKNALKILKCLKRVEDEFSILENEVSFADMGYDITKLIKETKIQVDCAITDILEDVEFN